ncbi:MAG: hypothetical protein IH624_16370 [Phycisphaerae bacterium]|nr:hypothetical protein [Phycisphaerae bacterium]
MLPLGSPTGIICDGLGSVVALSKWNCGLSRGEVVERYAYDAFGGTRIRDAAGGELT